MYNLNRKTEFSAGRFYRRTTIDGDFEFVRIDKVNQNDLYSVTYLEPMPYGLSVTDRASTDVYLHSDLWVEVHLC